MAKKRSKLPGQVSGRLLSLELGEQVLRGVVLKTSGNGAEILHAAAHQRTSEDIAEDLSVLLGSLGGYRGKAILVTDQVRFLAGELSFRDAEKLPREKINEAAKWEIEPYLDFQSDKGLFSCGLQLDMKREEGVPALISAMNEDGYAGFAGRFKELGLRLHSAFAPESVLACVCPRPEKGRNRIILNYTETSLSGVVLTPQGPTIFQNLPMAAGEGGGEESLRNMIYDLGVSAGSSYDIVVSGEAASSDLIQGLKTEFIEIEVWTDQYLNVLDTAGITQGFGADFALAAGAGIHCLGFSEEGFPGITDHVPFMESLSRKYNENKHLMPGIAAGLFLVFAVGHYAFMNYSIARYTSDIKALKIEKKKLLKPMEETKRLTNVLEETREKLAYLETVQSTGNGNLINLLSGISEQIPEDVVLNRVCQKKNNIYRIEGNAFLGRSVSDFEQALSHISGCRTTGLETLRRLEDASDTRKKMLPYEFVINLKF